MKNGGGFDIKSYIDELMDREEILETNMEKDQNIAYFYDDKYGFFDSDDEYLYNEDLDMYVNVSSKVSVSPGNYSASRIWFYVYVKIV